jgi:hypothetical protein
MRWNAGIVGFLFSFVLSAVCLADVVDLTPSQWGTILQVTGSAPSLQLSNGLGDIYVGRTNQDGQGPATISIRRGLVEFNVANYIPAGATITSVSMSMLDIRGLNGAPTISLHCVTQAWTQGTSYFPGGSGAPSTTGDVTWYYSSYNASNPSKSTPWTTPGGSFSSTVSGSAVDSDTNGTEELVTWNSTQQMVADVQSWLNNPSTNYGWLLQGDEAEGQTAKRYESAEANDGSVDVPTLQITYEDEGSSVPEPSSALLALTGVAWCGGMRIRRRGKR